MQVGIGLSSDEIAAVIDIVTSGKLNVALSKKAVKALVPQDIVPESAVLLAISRLNSSTFVRVSLFYIFYFI